MRCFFAKFCKNRAPASENLTNHSCKFLMNNKEMPLLQQYIFSNNSSTIFWKYSFEYSKLLLFQEKNTYPYSFSRRAEKKLAAHVKKSEWVTFLPALENLSFPYRSLSQTKSLYIPSHIWNLTKISLSFYAIKIKKRKKTLWIKLVVV